MSHPHTIRLIKSGKQNQKSIREIRQMITLYRNRLNSGRTLSMAELNALFDYLESESKKLLTRA